MQPCTFAGASKTFVFHFSELCENDNFSCESGLQCVEQGQVCDGFPNCWDFSDEIGCGM